MQSVGAFHTFTPILWSRFMSKLSLARVFAARSLTAATAVLLAGGGIAIAAATGMLPTAAHGPDGTPGQHPAVSSHPSGSDEATEPVESGESQQPSDVPRPSLDGLCHAFQAGATDNDGKAIDNPAFSVLVAAAGGAEQVAAFCDDRIGSAATHPHGAPSGLPAAHPTGPPSVDLPTHPDATSHPTGPPSHPTGRP
jgi:hypothetical protein